jgi:phosphopantothenoylcysteine decarboxylase / phosphopantothenate---cysteine ligase
MDLAGKTIVLGVTGGVAAFKAVELLRLLQAQGCKIHVVMTTAATHFIGTATFQSLSGNTVWVDQWDARMPNNMAHIDLTRQADLVLVAPASANFMSKLAHGLADDLLSTLCLARNCPLLIAPAMNKQMWEHPATQRNANTLRDDGVVLLGPDEGSQACGETGAGRMLEAADIAYETTAFFQAKLLKGKSVLITAGPTFEAIDPVRGITNHSSGKMGYALARACHEAGALVTMISGPTALAAPRGVCTHQVQSAQQMHDVVMAALKPTNKKTVPSQDIFIAVAAVADWRPASVASDKIKKTGKTPSIALVQNLDILALVAKLKYAPYCVGFAAESTKLLEHAQAKRERKGIPLLVGNIGHQTFGKDDNELILIDAKGIEKMARASKRVLAQQLVSAIASRINQTKSKSKSTK